MSIILKLIRLLRIVKTIILLVSFLQYSCRAVYPNLMFKEIESNKLPDKINTLTKEYKIQKGDEISLKVYTRNGMTLIDPIKSMAISANESGQNNPQIMNATFVVNNEGIIEFPIVGKMKVDGYNEEELRQILKKEFDNIYNNPFLYLKVENRRAIVFKGTEGMIVSLNRTPTNIFEVLAKSGGIDRHMKSYDIQLIRGNLKNPDIYKIDLSTLKGIQNSELLVQSNDIIYVQERRRPLYFTMVDMAPVITVPLAIVSSITSTILLFITINK